MLATIAAFLAVEGLHVQVKDFVTGNLQQNDPMIASHASLWYMRQKKNQVGRTYSVNAFRAKSESQENVFLPVQSKDPRGLAAGKLLVASRSLADPNFAKTVILLVHYDAGGVVGLILNRRSTDLPLSRVLDGLKEAKDRSDHVYLGGPVEIPAVFALLQSPTKLEGAENIFGSVYLISTKTVLEQAISKRPDPSTFHVYLGYAGWNAEQLRKEVEVGAWFIFPTDAKMVFDSDPDSLWPRMIHKTELQLARSTLKSTQSDRPETEPTSSTPSYRYWGGEFVGGD